MRFSQRLNFLYDPVIAELADAQNNLKIALEYVRSTTARPMPTFFEVDRSPAGVDPIWHMPKTPYTAFSRSIQLPSIRKSARSQLVNTPQGQTYVRADNFWLCNLALQMQDYFPNNGDMVAWNGYRYQIVEVNPDSETEFGQTGLWMWIVAKCMIVPYGDARFPPDFQLGAVAPAETPGVLQPPGVPNNA